MHDLTSFTDEENWSGGFYELAIEVGETSDERLQRALTALWRAADVDGCYARRDREPGEQEQVACTVSSLEEHGFLRGTVVLPSGHRVVCGCVAVREEDGPDWLDFYVPLGVLARVDRRIGAFPLDPSSGRASLVWRSALDRWFAGIGAEIFQEAAFRLGLIGFEVSGMAYAHEVDGTAPEERWEAYLLPAEGGLRFEPANR